ncbi:MAG: MT-A70 family methyltransferase, partial [Acidobacteria bacterium]|nr:MT-A70 family methyltransferase [Acidobacteriota bacterium]
NGEWFFGPGFWTRSNSEIVLMGKRGKGVPRVGKGVPQLLVSPMLGHSRKPHEAARRIDELIGPEVPKLELFARGDPEYLHLPQWSGTGLEYDGMRIEDFIKRNHEDLEFTSTKVLTPP